MTDGIKLVSENTANFASGRYLTKRYLDIITPQKEEERTADEIIAQIRKKLEVDR